MSQADKGFSAAWFVICIAHNISLIHSITSFYFASSAALVEQLPVWCTFSLPIIQLPAIQHMSFPLILFLTHSRRLEKKKNPDISLTHADLIFLSHIPTISIQVKLLPYIFCLSLPCDLLILHYSLQGYYGKLKCCIHPHRLYSIFWVQYIIKISCSASFLHAQFPIIKHTTAFNWDVVCFSLSLNS